MMFAPLFFFLCQSSWLFWPFHLPPFTSTRHQPVDYIEVVAARVQLFFFAALVVGRGAGRRTNHTHTRLSQTVCCAGVPFRWPRSAAFPNPFCLCARAVWPRERSGKRSERVHTAAAASLKGVLRCVSAPLPLRFARLGLSNRIPAAAQTGRLVGSLGLARRKVKLPVKDMSILRGKHERFRRQFGGKNACKAAIRAYKRMSVCFAFGILLKYAEFVE